MKRLLAILFCLYHVYPALSQSLMCESNEDYGFKGFIVADDKPYPADSLDAERIRIYYDFTYCNEKEISSSWLLQVGTNMTRFLPESRYKADSTQRVNSQRISNITNYLKEGDPFHCFDSYYISKDKCLFTFRIAADDMYYEEDIPSISWIQQDSVAIICGHLCRGATGTLRGRRYTVYYAEDIPVSTGPWKLTGLPGVILYADVDDGKFIFKAKQVVPSTGTSIMWAKYPYVQVSRQQYMKMLTQFKQHYISFFNAHLGRSNILKVNRTGIPNLSWIENIETE